MFAQPFVAAIWQRRRRRSTLTRAAFYAVSRSTARLAYDLPSLGSQIQKMWNFACESPCRIDSRRGDRPMHRPDARGGARDPSSDATARAPRAACRQVVSTRSYVVAEVTGLHARSPGCRMPNTRPYNWFALSTQRPGLRSIRCGDRCFGNVRRPTTNPSRWRVAEWRR